MQKQELTKTYFLAIQATYEGVECALGQATTVVAQKTLSKFDASRLLISTIDQMLVHNALTRTDLAYIAVNQGPGPFTTLRTVLATVNGLSYATGIPLFGVDGLAAFLDEVRTKEVIVVMLNAFNKDVYYAVAKQGISQEFGCKNGADLIIQLASRFSQEQITVVGNAVELWTRELVHAFGNRLQILQPNPHMVSIAQIAQRGWTQWKAGNHGMAELMPIYLKQHSAVMAR